MRGLALWRPGGNPGSAQNNPKSRFLLALQFLPEVLVSPSYPLSQIQRSKSPGDSKAGWIFALRAPCHHGWKGAPPGGACVHLESWLSPGGHAHWAALGPHSGGHTATWRLCREPWVLTPSQPCVSFLCAHPKLWFCCVHFDFSGLRRNCEFEKLELCGFPPSPSQSNWRLEGDAGPTQQTQGQGHRSEGSGDQRGQERCTL